MWAQSGLGSQDATLGRWPHGVPTRYSNDLMYLRANQVALVPSVQGRPCSNPNKIFIIERESTHAHVHTHVLSPESQVTWKL